VPYRAKEGAATTVWAAGALHRDKGAGALRAALRWRIAPAGWAVCAVPVPWCVTLRRVRVSSSLTGWPSSTHPPSCSCQQAPGVGHGV